MTDSLTANISIFCTFTLWAVQTSTNKLVKHLLKKKKKNFKKFSVSQSRSDTANAAAHQQRLLCILPGALTSHIDHWIRPYLSQSATARLVMGMVISRLDYCNSVFAGLPADQVAWLQRIQNNTSKLVMKKENEITLHLSSKNFTGYLWNSAASIRSQLWPIAILKGLHLRIFLHPSAPMNHLGLSDLPKKSYLKFPSKPEIFRGTFS